MGLPKLRMVVRPSGIKFLRPALRPRTAVIPDFVQRHPPVYSRITQPPLFRTRHTQVLAVMLEVTSVAMLVYGGMLAVGLVPGAGSGVAQAGLWGGMLALLGEGWTRLSSMISSPKPVAPKRPVRPPTATPSHAESVGRGLSRSNIPSVRREPRVTAPGAMVAEAVQVRMRLLEQQVGHRVRIARRLSEVENILPEEGKDGIFVVVKCVDKTIEVRVADHGEADRLVLDGEHKNSGGPVPINRVETILMLARLGGMKE